MPALFGTTLATASMGGSEQVARSWARSALLRGSKHDKYQHVYYYSRLRSRGVIPFEAGRATCFPQSDLPDTLLKRGIIMHWRVAEYQQDLTTDR